MPHSLRAFLGQLATARPDDLVNVAREVDPCQEAVALVRNLERVGRFPVVRFSRVRGATMDVLLNVHAHDDRFALSLGVAPSEFRATYRERMGARIPPRRVSEAPVQEVSRLGDQASLEALPLLTPFADCPAPYVSGGIMVVRDPDTRVQNLSYIRLMYAGPRQVVINAAPFQHTDTVIRNAARRGETCPAAVVIGYSPSFALGALARVPFEVDEHECCGGLAGEPVPVVRCLTQDLEVLADAEIVIEGQISPTVMQSEGPYGEFTGYALPAAPQPVMEVTAITHRERPIYQDVVPGGREHLMMGRLPKEVAQEAALRASFPFVRRAYMPPAGCARFHLVLTVAAHRPADLRRLALAVFASDHFLKHVFIVDEDVDPTDDMTVLQAMATCLQGDRDLLVLGRMPGSSLDPSAPDSVGAKIMFDCTRKGACFPPRFTMSPEVVTRMRPEEYL